MATELEFLTINWRQTICPKIFHPEAHAVRIVSFLGPTNDPEGRDIVYSDLTVGHLTALKDDH